MNVPASAITVLPASSLTRSRSQIPRGISSRRAAPVSRCTGYTARCRATSPGSCGRPGWGRVAGPLPPRVRGAGVLFVVRTHSLPFTRKETTRCPTLSAPLSRRSPHLLRPAAPPGLLVRLSRAPPRATALARVPDGAGRRRPGNDGRDLLLGRDPRRRAADGLSLCLGDALSPSDPHPGLASPPARRAARRAETGRAGYSEGHNPVADDGGVDTPGS